VRKNRHENQLNYFKGNIGFGQNLYQLKPSGWYVIKRSGMVVRAAYAQEIVTLEAWRNCRIAKAAANTATKKNETNNQQGWV
jgi:hypothetical protein